MQDSLVEVVKLIRLNRALHTYTYTQRYTRQTIPPITTSFAPRLTTGKELPAGSQEKPLKNPKLSQDFEP